jgi:hypothetical protein
MAKKKSISEQEEDALRDFIKKSKITPSEARLMLQELRNSAEIGAMIEADNDEAEFNKGGMPTKKSRGASDYRKGGMVLSTVDRRKRK